MDRRIPLFGVFLALAVQQILWWNDRLALGVATATAAVWAIVSSRHGALRPVAAAGWVVAAALAATGVLVAAAPLINGFDACPYDLCAEDVHNDPRWAVVVLAWPVVIGVGVAAAAACFVTRRMASDG